ncbi:hypothetical protein LC087_18320 [Bacillus carboniphilus]|uniref:Uncharacterized protein n=1 Tax=Bacillus carboniphilus TaxID=86663 RepID=A0ABY9JT87_9BACI|nr:hypothetical protein [Bacillus carboniphilus]WLR42607.1 hypothetical protein LC087_18320 [Bacillus carboniphilus]
MGEKLKDILKELKEIKQDVKVVKTATERFNKEETEEINLNDGNKQSESVNIEKLVTDFLEQNNKMLIDYIDSKTDALNKRVFRLEREIERLKRLQSESKADHGDEN